MMIGRKKANIVQGGDRKSEEIKVNNLTLISQEQAAADLGDLAFIRSGLPFL